MTENPKSQGHKAISQTIMQHQQHKKLFVYATILFPQLQSPSMLLGALAC